MGNIINPTPGDLADRQTILQVKLEYCGVEGDTGLQPVTDQVMELSTDKSVLRTILLDKTEINIQPFIIEHEAIQQRLERDWFPDLAISQIEDNLFDVLLTQLKAINKELWKLEDQARVLRAAPEKWQDTVLKRKAEVLDAITFNNDQRAKIVQKINALWGINIQEKVYR